MHYSWGMVYDLDFGRRVRCEPSERDRCARTAARIVALAEKARGEGLLSLEEDIGEIELDLLRDGVQLVVDGTDPSIVRSILETRIASGELRGADLLERCLVLEGALSVQAGDNPRITEMRLASFFGDGGPALLAGLVRAPEGPSPADAARRDRGPAPSATAPREPGRIQPEVEAQILEIAAMLSRRLEATRALQEQEVARSARAIAELLGPSGYAPPAAPGTQDVEVEALRWIAGRSPEILAALPRLLPGPVAEVVSIRIPAFEELALLSDRDMQKLLRRIDSPCLARALKEAPEVAAKAFRNMSTRASALLKEDMDAMGPVALESVLSERHAILRIAWLLMADGEIRPPPAGALLQ
jgi:hypothetical protein